MLSVKRLSMVALFIMVPAIATGAILYPWWSRIPIGFISTQPLVNPNEPLAHFGAEFLGIPSGFDQYQIHISFNPPKECAGAPIPSTNPAFVEYNLQPGDALLPYMKQVFASTSCESIFSDHKNEGLPQYLNGSYNFCLPASSPVSFLYPAGAPIPLHLTSPGVWTSGDNSCSDLLLAKQEQEISSPSHLPPFLQIYATPYIGESIIGWLGSLLAWVVIVASGVTLYEFIRRK